MKIQDYESYIAERINGSVARTPYLNDVNDFPSVCVLRNTITRQHIGAGRQEYVESFILRAYAHSSIESAIESAEILARAIEHNTASFVRDYLIDVAVNYIGIATQDAQVLTTQSLFMLVAQSPETNKLGSRIIRDARVLSITTDEGFLAPYSLCETEIELSYDYTNTDN